MPLTRRRLLPLFLFSLLVFVVGIMSPRMARSQTGMDLVPPARGAALAGATTALPGDLGSHANPAGNAAAVRRGFVFYAQEAYRLQALRLTGVHSVVPLAWATVTGGLSAFGFEDYQEVYASAGVARGFALGTTRKVYAGARLRYYHTHISSYGSARALGLSMGLLVAALPTLHLGAQLINLNAPSLTRDSSLPQVLALGVAYQAHTSAQILLDLVKDIDFPLSVRSGLEVYPVPRLALRVGVATEPTRFAAGAGLRVGRLRADLAADRHLDLGWTPSIALGLQW